MSALRAAVIGLGVGEAHAKAYAAHPQVRLVAVCDLDADKARDIAGQYPSCVAVEHADAVLDDPDIDLVSIASYDDAHAAQVIRGIGSGKHVFAEKPLCQTEGELAAIAAALRSAHGVRLSCNLILREAAHFRAAREAIGSGVIGQVCHVDADYLYGRLHKLHRGWRGGVPGYSVMLGGGVHMIDLAMWLTGLRPEEVCAMSNRVATAGSGAGFPGNDTTVALLRAASGATMKISANFSCVRPHVHEVVIYGTEGTLRNTRAGTTLQTSRDRDHAPRVIGQAGAPDKGDLIAPFIGAIMDDAPSPVLEQEVFDAMSVGLAIDRASRSGLRERVGYVE